MELEVSTFHGTTDHIVSTILNPVITCNCGEKKIYHTSKIFTWITNNKKLQSLIQDEGNIPSLPPFPPKNIEKNE